jgi:hypothetical protein
MMPTKSMWTDSFTEFVNCKNNIGIARKLARLEVNRITDVSIPYSERLFHNGAEQPATDDNGNKIKHSVKHEVFIVKKLVLGINNVKVS